MATTPTLNAPLAAYPAPRSADCSTERFVMQKITVEILANGYTGLTAENIKKALNHYFGSPALKVSFSVIEAAQQCVHPTNGGLALRACVSADCGWVGKESACLTWKHAGDERLCPHCHDNTELVSLSVISG